MFPEKSSATILREGEKELERGHIGLAKKCVVKAAMRLQEEGKKAEEFEPLLKLARDILLGEALEKELAAQNPSTRNYLAQCTQRLKEYGEKTKKETLRKLSGVS